MKIAFKYRQNQKYKQKTLSVNYEDVKSDFWEMPGAYDTQKVVDICKKYIADNGGGVLVRFIAIS